jgi:hypothetical protein
MFTLVETFYALCVALFVFFGLCALRELIIRRFVEETERFAVELYKKESEHGDQSV